MKQGEEWKTAFRTKYEYYKYTIILFGLTNVSATIQCLINDIFREYLDRFYITYLDNIFIFLDNEKEYKEYILIIFKALQKASLRIKSEKYKFHI